MNDMRYLQNPNHQSQNIFSLFPHFNRSMVTIYSSGTSQQTRIYPKEENGNKSNAYLSIGNQANGDGDGDEEEKGKYDVRVSGYRRARKEGESSNDSRGRRRKLNNCASGFQLVPRTELPLISVSSSVALTSKTHNRKNPADWTEDSTFVLLDSWGVFYVMNGRKSLRSDEWMEVSKKVNDATRNPRTDAQCRNRIDTLKKKYKKEKARIAESICLDSRWVYFKKMEQLMGMPKQHAVVPLRRRQRQKPNNLNGTRDNPLGSQLISHGSNGLPSQNLKKSSDDPLSTSFKVLVDSIKKIGMVYENINISNRNHMLKLKNMRMEFERDLESQSQRILERAMREHKRLRREERYNDEKSEDSDEENNDNKGIECSDSVQNETS